LTNGLTAFLHGAAPESLGRIRAIVCDDAPALRMLFRVELEADGDIVVVGEAADGSEVIEAARLARPDVVLLDLSMPKCSGLEAIGLLLADDPGARIVVLSGSADEVAAREALDRGAFTYLTKGTPAAKLRDTVRAAAALRLPGGGDDGRAVPPGWSPG
jgi:DNA-binding NarL/FixJ family response regulator